jgi:hypothetical protein
VHDTKGIKSFFEGAFKDKRIDKRANKKLESIIGNGCAIVNKCCSSMTEKWELTGCLIMINWMWNLSGNSFIRIA